MSNRTIQDIVPLCEKPSRYLGCEINHIKKEEASVKLKMALIFPDLYEIGTSHFGIQILYSILNAHPDIAAERAFYPGHDMENYLRTEKIPFSSLETKRPISGFDIVGFSLLYELNYTNILSILDMSNIPFLSSERKSDHPFIIAGGPSTFNPEPVADIFDAMVVGDGETVIIEMAESWISWKEKDGKDKEALLKRWSEIQGVYIPSFFKPVYKSDPLNRIISDVEGLEITFPHYSRVKRAIIPDIDQMPTPDSPIVPFGKPVHDRFRIEIARGCSRGCRFCQAGIIYRPVREKSVDHIYEIAVKGIQKTGYDDISLLSLSTGDYSDLTGLIRRLMNGCGEKNPYLNHTAVSLPSVRADMLSPELMNLIKRVRKTGFTIAPEAGTDRLRRVINKGLTEEEIIDTVKSAFQLGWKVIKLYFMVGLPTETNEDIQGIVDLVKKLRNIPFGKGRKPTLNVSVTTFIPKAHTSFQWIRQLSYEESREKISWLKKSLELHGVQFKWQDPEVSLLEGIFSRGDRRLTPLLISAYKKGCKLDGWHDHFNFSLWKEAFTDHNFDIYQFGITDIQTGCALPWDHIDSMVKKEFLIEEWHKALRCDFTADCRKNPCSGCGICDFKTIQPILFDTLSQRDDLPINQAFLDFKNINHQKNNEISFEYTISFSKQDEARFLGHLELINIVMRAIKRAGVPISFSKGFHPLPKLSFEDPLPVGTETLENFLFISLERPVDPHTIIEAMNQELPRGIRFHRCALETKKKRRLSEVEQTIYAIYSKERPFEQERLDHFFLQENFLFSKISKNGQKKEIDLRSQVLTISCSDSHNLSMVLKKEPNCSVRPTDVIKSLFHFSDTETQSLRVIKMPPYENQLHM